MTWNGERGSKWNGLSRRTPLKRSAPPRKKRPGVRKGQPTNAEKEAERNRVYERCGGRCELRDENGQPLHAKHISGVLPSDGDVMYRWHLVHWKAKRRFGWTEAQGNVLLGGCYWCHIGASHNRGVKIVPPRERVTE